MPESSPKDEPPLAQSKAKPKNRWRLAYVVSLFLGASLLAGTLAHRPSDCDEAEFFYRAGLTPWSEVIRSIVLPADPKPFLMQRSRPASALLAPKVLWALGTSPKQYQSMVWVLGWFMVLAFAWSMGTALRAAGAKLHPEFDWILALLIWWAAPMQMFSSFGAANYWIYGLCNLAIGLVLHPSRRHLKARYAACIPLALLAFHAYEGFWYYFVWLGLWLYFRGHDSKSAKEGKVGGNTPPFYAPLVTLAILVLIYRSVLPSDRVASAQTNPDGFVFSLAPQVLASNAYYFALVLFNGMAKPFSNWVYGPDTTPADLPLALGLTLGAIYLVFKNFRASKSSSRQKLLLTQISLCCGAVVLGASAPHWAIANRHFVYFPLFPMFFLITAFAAFAAPASQFKAAPVILLVAANAMASVQSQTRWNWNDSNLAVATKFYEEVKARPDLRDCSSAQPCCMTLRSRYWGHNEWVLSWLAGGGRQPAFVPEGFPNASCVRHVQFD